jgi:acyl carrier protein
MDIRETVRAFIIDNFLFGDAGELENETSFLDSGVIDSTGMLELITYLEEHFNIRIEDEEMLPENMDSLNNVAAFLERKKGLQG